MRRNVRFAVLSAMVLLLRAGSPAAADDSPEDVAERINKALDNQDATALVAEIAPSQRGEMLLEFADMVSMFAADPEKGAEINEEWESLVAEHGFTEDVKRWQEGQELAYAERTKFNEEEVAKLRQRDCSAFAAAVLEIIDRLTEGSFFSGFPRGQLTALEVDGDSASGEVDGATVNFVKEEGRWYMTV